MLKIICVVAILLGNITSLEKVSPQIDKKYFKLIAASDESPLKTYIAITEKDKVFFIRDTKTLVFEKKQFILYTKETIYISTKNKQYIFKKL